MLCLVLFQLFVVDNCVDDWRIALSLRGALLIAAELVVCSVHPVPGSYHFLWMSPRHRRQHAVNNDDHSSEDDDDETNRLLMRAMTTDGDDVTSAKVPFDVLLSLPMFLRLYLVGRGTVYRDI